LTDLALVEALDSLGGGFEVEDRLLDVGGEVFVPRSADEPKGRFKTGDPKSGLPTVICRSHHMTTEATGKLTASLQRCL